MRAIDAALLIVALGLAGSCYRAHKDKNGLRHFNLFDLIMENDRVSKLATAFVGGMVVVSWLMVKLALDGDMTEGFLGLYLTGVIAPIIAKLFSPPAAPSVKTVEETKTTTTTTGSPPLAAHQNIEATVGTMEVKADNVNLSEHKK